MIDYQGMAILIGAITAFLTVVGGFAMQIAIFIRQGHAIQVSKELNASVDGQSKLLNEAVRSGAFSAGEAAGVATERANPQIASPRHPKAT